MAEKIIQSKMQGTEKTKWTIFVKSKNASRHSTWAK